ncbi:MAG: glutamate--tRNA ligase [Pirellulales bacterium]|nr:glutamate--tRNA ligase [Pirellulales bacterium]
MTVRTRFAPSPTGYLHIGGVRTALFCWLFARRHGGQFILRIDDTDQQRNVEEALAPILHGLKWLGIDWDEGPEVGGPYAPYYQSQRLDRYRAAVEKLLAGGHAYHDYATPEEIQAERKAAEAEKRIFTYSRRFLAETPADCARFEAEGRKGVVRLKMPREGKLVLDDLVRGRVEFNWANEQDHVVQRADGSCLYHLANVVDDEDFHISHVIRAEEHLSNTPRQVFLIQALGYNLPQYAHLPFVAEPGSKNKLSKRKLDKYLKNKDFAQLVEHGNKILHAIGEEKPPELLNPVMVDFYESVGYLPEAIVNYLTLLGWSWDDKTEQFTREELIEKFSLDRVNKAPASFDPKKLLAFQLRHMQVLPVEQKVPLVLPYLQKAGLLSEQPNKLDFGKVAAVVRAAGDRIKVAGDVLDFPEFFVSDEQLVVDPDARGKAFGKPEAVDLLKKWLEILQTVKPFDDPTLEKRLHEFVAAEGIKIGQIIHPLRVALTGKAVGLGLFDTFAILGRLVSMSRIKRTLRSIESMPL